MVSIKYLKSYCSGDITKIENYEKAVSDPEVVYHVHHLLEEQGYSRQDLIEMERYYKVPPEELKLMTPEEHHRLHNVGKTPTDETKKKMSNSHKSTPKVHCEELDKTFDSYAECNREIAEYLGLKSFNVKYVIEHQGGHCIKHDLHFYEIHE